MFKMTDNFSRQDGEVVAIYGTGGCGRALAHSLVASCSTASRNDGIPRQVVFVDDDSTRTAPLPVLSFAQLQPTDRFVIAIADGQIRQKLEKQCLDAGLLPFNFFAPDFEQGYDNKIGDGSVFMAKSMVTTNVSIGRQFQCNIYSYIEHDCVIGNYVTFAPRVNCNGNVHIGDFAYIGSGAVIKQGTSDRPRVIGHNAVVGMGAVVTRDVPPGAVVIGNPARPR